MRNAELSALAAAAAAADKEMSAERMSWMRELNSDYSVKWCCCRSERVNLAAADKETTVGYDRESWVRWRDSSNC